MVFQGRACQSQTPPHRKSTSGLDHLRGRILQHMGFVEDRQRPFPPGQQRRIADHQRIGSHHHLGVRRQRLGLPIRTVMGDHAQARRELGAFPHPVGHQAGGAHHQGGIGHPSPGAFIQQMGEGLDGFSQTHVVGEDAAQAQIGQKPQPTDPLFLVGPQGREQSLRLVQGTHGPERLQPRAEIAQRGRHRPFLDPEILHQRRFQPPQSRSASHIEDGLQSLTDSDHPFGGNAHHAVGGADRIGTPRGHPGAHDVQGAFAQDFLENRHQIHSPPVDFDSQSQPVPLGVFVFRQTSPPGFLPWRRLRAHHQFGRSRGGWIGLAIGAIPGTLDQSNRMAAPDHATGPTPRNPSRIQRKWKLHGDGHPAGFGHRPVQDPIARVQGHPS